MPRCIMVALLMAAVLPNDVSGQDTVSADSLVAEFIAKGPASSWQPYDIFRSCPVRDPTQERAFDLLANAELPRDLAHARLIAWTGSLRGCHDPRLVNWFFEQLDEGIRSGRSANSLFEVLGAFSYGSSPEIRARLREYVLRADVPEDIRAEAGHSIFAAIDGSERREEFVRLFRSGRVPWELAIGLGAVMVQQDMEWTLTETVRMVADDPGLADQHLFRQIITSARQFAPGQMKEAMASGLEAVAAQGGNDAERAEAFRSTAQWLRTPHPENP